MPAETAGQAPCIDEAVKRRRTQPIADRAPVDRPGNCQVLSGCTPASPRQGRPRSPETRPETSNCARVVVDRPNRHLRLGNRCGRGSVPAGRGSASVQENGRVSRLSGHGSCRDRDRRVTHDRPRRRLVVVGLLASLVLGLVGVSAWAFVGHHTPRVLALPDVQPPTGSTTHTSGPTTTVAPVSTTVIIATTVPSTNAPRYVSPSTVPTTPPTTKPPTTTTPTTSTVADGQLAHHAVYGGLSYDSSSVLADADRARHHHQHRGHGGQFHRRPSSRRLQHSVEHLYIDTDARAELRRPSPILPNVAGPLSRHAPGHRPRRRQRIADASRHHVGRDRKLGPSCPTEAQGRMLAVVSGPNQIVNGPWSHHQGRPVILQVTTTARIGVRSWSALSHPGPGDPFTQGLPGVAVSMAPSDRHNPAGTKTSRVVAVVTRRPWRSDHSPRETEAGSCT